MGETDLAFADFGRGGGSGAVAVSDIRELLRAAGGAFAGVRGVAAIRVLTGAVE